MLTQHVPQMGRASVTFGKNSPLASNTNRRGAGQRLWRRLPIFGIHPNIRKLGVIVMVWSARLSGARRTLMTLKLAVVPMRTHVRTLPGALKTLLTESIGFLGKLTRLTLTGHSRRLS